MPLTQLDPRPALIIIDLQKGIVVIPTVTPTSEVVSRSAQLAAAFRKRGLPVVLVNVTAAAPGRTDMKRTAMAFPDGWTDLVPELNQQPEDILISKQRVGAFIGTTLDEELRMRGVTQVFITGVATSAGVAATARSASDFGYNVVLVTDAVTDREADVQAFFLDRIFPRMGETETTQVILKLLEA